MNDYRLILLDIDGTLCDRDSTEIYPAMRRFIEALDASVQVAFLTNQGGPPCRNAGWEFSHTFPSQEKIQARLDKLMKVVYGLLGGRKPSLYVAWVYQAKNGQVYNLSGLVEDNWEIKKCLFWRKPGPGMILQALMDSQTMPADTLMIGDRPEDRGAAEAAGVAFRHADDI